MISEKEVGRIFKFFNKISVAAVIITYDILSIGDKIHIKGNITDFKQEVESMQIDKHNVEEAPAGKSVGLKVEHLVRVGDIVYKVL